MRLCCILTAKKKVQRKPEIAAHVTEIQECRIVGIKQIRWEVRASACGRCLLSADLTGATFSSLCKILTPVSMIISE